MSALEDLLVVQEHDTAADRLRHKKETLPERARLGEVEAAIGALNASIVDVGGRRDEVARREQRHEDELASIEAKISEVEKRLYSGTVSAPRELQAMEADIASLKRHRSDIEERVLETVQEWEPLEVEVSTLEEQRSALEAEADRL